MNIAAELIPQEWTKTQNISKICPHNNLIESGNPAYWQHEIYGCSVFFVSKHKDEYGFYSVIYCTIPDELYRTLLRIENEDLLPGERLHEDLSPNTIFTFDDQLLVGNQPTYIF